MPALRSLRVRANRMLSATCGLSLRRASAPGRYWADGLAHLKQRGFAPKSIIDVGVLYGTHELYEAFPGARLFLFEPNPDCKQALHRLRRQYGALAFNAAAGPKTGAIDFWRRPSDPGASSLTADGDSRAERISVPEVRVDDSLRACEVPEPVLLKIDVEGFELDVIAGCTGLLGKIEVVIMESRFFRYHERMREFSEVITEMGRLDYAVYDIMDGAYRPQDQVLDFVDLVFVRKNSRLRPQYNGHWHEVDEIGSSSSTLSAAEAV
jgi:FkbM family methyltransferase